jgi:putative oxidoreductase
MNRVKSHLTGGVNFGIYSVMALDRAVGKKTNGHPILLYGKISHYVTEFPFPTYHSMGLSTLLLVCRIAFGSMFISHGLQKLASFSIISNTFPSVMGMGSKLSLCLAIFAEVFCTMGFITGFLYRLSMLPMIFTMCMAAFVIHAKDPFSTKELALLYLFVFIMMYILGPGSFAADWFFAKR